MVVDAVIFCKATDKAKENLAALNWRFVDVFSNHSTLRLDGDTIEVSNGWRYYGPGYERGPWPEIYAAIVWLRENVGPVHYGGDSDDREDIPVVTDTALAEIWNHWKSVGHTPYRNIQNAKQCCGGPMREDWGSGGLQQLICIVCEREITVNHVGQEVEKNWSRP